MRGWGLGLFIRIGFGRSIRADRGIQRGRRSVPWERGRHASPDFEGLSVYCIVFRVFLAFLQCVFLA